MAVGDRQQIGVVICCRHARRGRFTDRAADADFAGQTGPGHSPIREIKRLADEALSKLDPVFDEMYASSGQPSIPPERLFKGPLLIALYSVRSERQFYERLDYDPLFRFFLDMNMDDPSWNATTFSRVGCQPLRDGFPPRHQVQIGLGRRPDVEERDYPDGLDCVWIASDRDGRVGAFITGGEGPIPTQAVLSHRLPVDEIEARLGKLPSTSIARLLVPMKRPDDFLELARRGVFAYDWTDVHRTRSEALHAYEQIAAPGTPIAAGELPKEIAALLEGIVLNVSFAHQPSIDVTKHLNWRQPL